MEKVRRTNAMPANITFFCFPNESSATVLFAFFHSSSFLPSAHFLASNQSLCVCKLLLTDVDVCRSWIGLSNAYMPRENIQPLLFDKINALSRVSRFLFTCQTPSFPKEKTMHCSKKFVAGNQTHLSTHCKQRNRKASKDTLKFISM